MKKMKTLFEQDENHMVVDKLRDENEFILGDNWEASRKRDGTSCFYERNVFYRRYDANKNKGIEIPEGSILCQEEPAPNGSFPVWKPIDENNPQDKLHAETLFYSFEWQDGSYELCGPKVNGNKENLVDHKLFRHGEELIEIKDVSFNGIKKFLEDNEIEGLVFKDLDTGLMTKIRRKDFGLPW